MKISKIKAKSGVALRASSLFLVSLVLATSSGTILLRSDVMAATPKSLSYNPAYVAFGDSLTTGSSIATCNDDRKQSPWGCTELPTATPYPDRIARQLHLSYGDIAANYAQQNFDLYRAGIWGYSLQEAVQAEKHRHNVEGDWVPQLNAIKQAHQLVTGALGINDMHFNDIARWIKLYLKPGGDFITPAAEKIVADRSNDFDKLFEALKTAKANGATVILGLYYNPYDTSGQPCSQLKTIGDRIVNPLDDELLNRAHASGLHVADFRRFFSNHGAGSKDSYVFGTDCSLGAGGRAWLESMVRRQDIKKTVAVRFDPHPNNSGTKIMANAILQEYNYAD